MKGAMVQVRWSTKIKTSIMADGVWISRWEKESTSMPTEPRSLENSIGMSPMEHVLSCAQVKRTRKLTSRRKGIPKTRGSN